MLENNNSDTLGISRDESFSPTRALVSLILSIFFVELAIMVIFLILPPLPPVTEMLVDSTTLILIVSPIVYRFAFVPLHRQIAKTKDAISKLESLNEVLEQRVVERTKDLETARLQSENRARELQSIGEISKAIAGEQKTENLLPLITRLVS